MVVELDPGGLIKIFQHVIIALHRVNPPQLNVLAFKLDGDPHFHAGVASGHIGDATAHLPDRLRGANALNVGCGLWRNLVVLAPSAKGFICEHGCGRVSCVHRRGEESPGAPSPEEA